MRFFARAFALLLIVSVSAMPIPVIRAETGATHSFGGKVLSMTPCANLPGTFQVVIQPAGFFQPLYIWAPPPLTVTMLDGAPLENGEIVGVATTAFTSICVTLTRTCFLFFCAWVPTVLPGQQIIYAGTGLPKTISI